MQMKGGASYDNNKYNNTYGRRVKKQFNHFCDEIGMSMGTAITIFAKTVYNLIGCLYTI